MDAPNAGSRTTADLASELARVMLRPYIPKLVGIADELGLTIQIRIKRLPDGRIRVNVCVED